jgi:signal peptidase I
MAFVFWIVALLLLLIDRGTTRSPDARSPYKAAAGSLFSPGLGQLYNGEPKKALALWAGGVVPILLARILGALHSFWGMFVTLVIATALAVVGLIDAIRTARSLQSYAPKAFNRWYIYVGLVVLAALVSIPVRNMMGVRAFKIPSEGMLPTLEVGDFIIAKLESGDSYKDKRGDILVFKYPGDGKSDYIKRVAALPGETIEIRNDTLLIDGTAIRDGWVQISGESNRQVVPNFGPFMVPDETLFMLGDNLVNSADSRVWGPMPKRNIVGIAKFVYFSWDPVRKNVRLSRVGLAVDNNE